MSDTILSVKIFAGTVDSTSGQFQGLKAPAALTIIERDAEYECKFVFFAGALPFTVRAPRAGDLVIRGVAPDPRGWNVSFKAELNRDRVTGTYDQPHDRGTFELRQI